MVKIFSFKDIESALKDETPIRIKIKGERSGMSWTSVRLTEGFK